MDARWTRAYMRDKYSSKKEDVPCEVGYVYYYMFSVPIVSHLLYKLHSKYMLLHIAGMWYG